MFRCIPKRTSIDLYQPEIVHYVCAVVIRANVRLGNNLVPLIAMPPSFVSYAQGRELCPKKAACNVDPKTDYVYHLLVSYLDRGIPDKLELGKRTSVYLTVNQR